METERAEEIVYRTLSEKEQRNLVMLELIRRRGPISRADISKATGINLVSISNYMKGFADKKIVIEREAPSSGGRKPELAMLNTDENYVIGIDVGAKEASAVLADIGLNMTKRFKAQETDPAAFIGEITKKSSLAAGKIKAVGMGVSSAEPGRIASDMKKKTGMAVFAESKSVCAAIGEKCLNKELDDGAVLYMYSDAGSGVIMKDRTFTEENRYLKPWPEHIGIRAAAKRGVAKGVGTAIVDFANGDIENITEETVIKAALAKDEVALDIVQSAGLNLGVRIAYLVNLFGPKTIVIGGGTEKAGELILGPMMRTVRRFALNERKTRVNIIPCSLGNEAVSVGAAAVAVREIFLTA